MAYRKFDTGTWQDVWFEQLEPQGKLLFIYLWTNDVVTQSGCYRISKRRIEFETGIPFEEIIPKLSKKVTWYPDEQIVWVKKFFEWQCQNSSFAKAAIKSLDCIPDPIRNEWMVYNKLEHHVNTMSTPSNHCAVISNSNSNSNSTETVTVKKEDDSGVASSCFFECDYFFVENGKAKELCSAYCLTDDDLVIKLKRMKVWLDANPEKRKKNYQRFIINWLGREKENGSNNTGSTVKADGKKKVGCENEYPVDFE